MIYNERRSVFEQISVREWFVQFAEKSLDDLFIKFKSSNDDDISKFVTLKLQNLLGVPFNVNCFLDQDDLDEHASFLQQQIQIAYDVKELEMEMIQIGLLRELEKTFILQQIDRSWMEHLQKMAFLRDSVRWIAYGQKDPLTEYKKEAFNYFNIMLAKIRHRVVYFVLRSKIILQ